MQMEEVMARIIFLAMRHHNVTHEYAARRQFGEDVQIFSEDLQWGNDPIGILQSKLEELSAAGHEVVAAMPTGSDRQLAALIGCPLDIPFYRAVFETDERGRSVRFHGGRDERDFVVIRYARMEVRVESVVRTVEDVKVSLAAVRALYDEGWRAGYEAGYSDGVGGHTPAFDVVVDGAGLFRGRNGGKQ